jgi:ribose transport system permease protein
VLQLSPNSTEDRVSPEQEMREPSGDMSIQEPGGHSHSQAMTTGRRRSVLRAIAPTNMSAVYVLAALILLFSLWVPDTFLTTTNFKTLLNQQAVPTLVALGLVVPLSAGVFDLAIGATVGVSAILVAFLLDAGMAPAAAVLIAVAAGATIGLTNGLLVTRARVDSFIATLGMASILAALIQWISPQQIVNLPNSFLSLASRQLLGISYPVYYMLIVAACVWYVLERTPVGRRIYATGGNAEAARLSGVSTKKIIVASFIVCGLIAGFGGVLITSNLGIGDPTVGPGYLLPAFTAAFLGSTQFRGGRFNVWGTVLAVYLLATGVKGLQLAGAPLWIPDLFNGLALLVAVAGAKYQRNLGRTSAIARLVSRGRGRTQDTPVPVEQRSPNG